MSSDGQRTTALGGASGSLYRRFIVVLAVAVLTAGNASAVASNEPTVIAQSQGGFVLGKLELEVSCTAKANQSLATVTIISRCYTTNGLAAPGDTEAGAVAQAQTAGEVAAGSLGDMTICAEAMSYDKFGVPSDPFFGCQDVNPIADAGTVTVSSGVFTSNADPRRAVDNVIDPLTCCLLP